jgi:cholesterol transport system auxiliary component
MIRLSVLAIPLLLSGCGALSLLSDAGRELDAYTLSPAEGTGPAASGRLHLVVELPTSGGAIGTDRILIKPVPYQAQYLPDGRWSEPAPILVQNLLVASFQSIGGFGLVGRTGAGLMPDYTLMTEVQEFQAEPAVPDTGGFSLKVGMLVTLIRESDRRIVASRRIAATGSVASDETASLVAGFDRAMQAVLTETVLWTISLTSGRRAD